MGYSIRGQKVKRYYLERNLKKKKEKVGPWVKNKEVLVKSQWSGLKSM